jgi:hypothetical protein
MIILGTFSFFIPKVLFNVNEQAHIVVRFKKKKCYPSVLEMYSFYYEYVLNSCLILVANILKKQAMLICKLCDFKH